MARNWMRQILAGCAGLVLAAGLPAPAAEEAPVVLRHAVACPPFKGDPAIAAIYHAEMVRMLRATEGVAYLEADRPRPRRNPEFTYHINGAIVTNEDGQLFVMVTLTDEARQERIASHIAPASIDPEIVAAWTRTIQADMTRRARKLPFECRVRRKAGQASVSLDRGLDAGLQPGMVLYVSMEEEALISPVTGEVIGRDSPRAVGQIQIFRVMEDTAYARPVLDTKLPLFAKLYAREF